MNHVGARELYAQSKCTKRAQAVLAARRHDQATLHDEPLRNEAKVYHRRTLAVLAARRHDEALHNDEALVVATSRIDEATLHEALLQNVYTRI